jgi:aryl-alcohol dehydrogenase-like predicted oxidoreductase
VISAPPRFASEARSANWALVERLTRIGAQKGATPAQIALAWLPAQRDWIIPIPGTRSLSRIEENSAAADIALSAEEVSEVTSAAEAVPIKGDRYSEAIER